LTCSKKFWGFGEIRGRNCAQGPGENTWGQLVLPGMGRNPGVGEKWGGHKKGGVVEKNGGATQILCAGVKHRRGKSG